MFEVMCLCVHMQADAPHATSSSELDSAGSFGLGRPGPLLSSHFFAPASDIKNSVTDRNSKHGASEMLFVRRHNSGTNHRTGKRGKLFV